MENINLVESFSEFKEFKNIDRSTMMLILEDVFRNMLQKKYGSAENFDIIVNIDKGDLEVWRNRVIVEDGAVEDPNEEIQYSEAIKIEPDFEIGEEVSEPVRMSDFGRREILAIRQNLASKILELEKDSIYQKYQERVGELITAEVYQVWKKELLALDDEGIELILPKTEQIPSDFFRKGDTVRAVVASVEIKNNNPLIILSRTSNVFLERLFEQEVPEVHDGLITIRKIVRAPGERAKVAVESYDDRIDPVGACVGMKGSRIHGIVRELRNENIDVINFTSNPSLYISRALSPAKISSINIDEETKRAEVYLKPDQVSLAIGKGGFNIKLAGTLTGYEIDVYRDTDQDTEDVDIHEFADEIEQWIIDEFKAVGLDTAKSILNLSIEDLVKRVDLEEETIKEVISILKAEFE
ncbi:MAG: transcription termination/antitermination protein NusA [Bacteroidetes bacterium]|nr:MAG: transcription termination/antitermination protein NusA [Bacteroidota bacterium]